MGKPGGKSGCCLEVGKSNHKDKRFARISARCEPRKGVRILKDLACGTIYFTTAKAQLVEQLTRQLDCVGPGLI